MELEVEDNCINYDKDSEEYYHNLNIIRETIEKMNKFNQIEVLKILMKHNDIVINENKYGVHINLSEITPSIIDELSEYINYVNLQENYLNDIKTKIDQIKSEKDVKSKPLVFNLEKFFNDKFFLINDSEIFL